MQIKHILIIAFTLLTTPVTAQYIAPSDLVKINTYWQMNDPDIVKNVYTYLTSVDNKWKLLVKPSSDANGYTAIFGYSKDGKGWYIPDECHLTIMSNGGQKVIFYMFTDADTYNIYTKQMALMEATKVGSGPNNGGSQTIYKVNDIVFTLAEFPPGINGTDRVYQISILKDPNVTH